MKKRILIIILLMVAVIATGTLAWLTFGTKKSALVLTVGDINNVKITVYPYQFKGTLTPVSNYTSMTEYVQVTAVNSKTSATKLSLYYDINSIDSSLKDAGFKYTITKSSSLNGTYTSHLTGNFSSANVGTKFNIMTDESVAASTTNYYRVYLWIDSSAGNQANMQGKVFNAEMNAIYNEEHTLTISAVTGGSVSCTNNTNNTTSSSSLNLYYGDFITCTSTPNTGYTTGVLKIGNTSTEQSGTKFKYYYNENKTLTATFFQTVTTLSYTGAAQTYPVYRSGIYKVELWGASGGGSYGGYGGYTSGNILLVGKENLYFYVGSNPSGIDGGYNGGGNGYSATSGAGGGATDARLVSGDWNNASSLNSRIMVAAGGGGSVNAASTRFQIGYGGGLFGYTGKDNNYATYTSTGGTQVSGGIVTNYSSSYSLGTDGTFGIGGIGGGASNSGSSGGAGGYYGGAGGSRLNSGSWLGGGGSSFISGHTGCVAIAGNANTSNPRVARSGSSGTSACTMGTNDNLCSVHYSGRTFTDTLMIDGAGYTWTNVKAGTVGTNLMPNPTGGNYDSGVGHTGNGYARITFVSDFSTND